MSHPPPPAVLVFAASDPTGGTGLQADVLTISSMGCHALSVVTAITVQDTAGSTSLHQIDPDWIIEQARCVLEDIPVVVFKIGLLGSAEATAAVAEVVSDYPDVPLVLDPALTNGRGDELASEEAIAALSEMIVPQTTLLTPNTFEIRRLAMEDGGDEDSKIEQCAKRLIASGCEFLLLTGTHANTAKVVNTLFGKKGRIRSDDWERLPNAFHGAGNTLAAACAAVIAQGLDIPEAVREAQEFTWESLKHGFRPGMGNHLPDRMFWALDHDTENQQ